jgi:pimeloyl-ACP methyl ester carboxylesterase
VLSNVDVMWEEPSCERLLRRLPGFSRVVVIDRRGYGCSERFSPDDVAPLEALVDVVVVLAALGVDRTAAFAFEEANFLATVLAASRPELVSHLVLLDPSASWLRNDDLPWEWDEKTWEQRIRQYHDEWGLSSPERFVAEERWWTERGSEPEGHANLDRHRGQGVRRIGPPSHRRFGPCSSLSCISCCTVWSGSSSAPPTT